MIFSGGLAVAPPSTGPVAASGIVNCSWNFSNGTQGWLPGYSDYKLRTKGLDRIAELRRLPEEVSAPEGHLGYYLQANNHSGDLFLYLKRQVGPTEGLQPNRAYLAHIHVQAVCQSKEIFLRAGVTWEEPSTTLIGDYAAFNLNKGRGPIGGVDLRLMSDEQTQDAARPVGDQFHLLSRSVHQPAPVRTDQEGTLWITVGSDSASDGLVGIYQYTVGIALIPA